MMALILDLSPFATLFFHGRVYINGLLGGGRLYSNMTSHGHEHELRTTSKDVTRLLKVTSEDGVEEA